MTGAETAEAFLTVVKRLAKWALWFAAGLAILFGLVLGGEWVGDYVENRPHQAKRYVDLNLGDSQKEVLYALGPPSLYLMPSSPPLPGERPSAFGTEDKIVREVTDGKNSKDSHLDSTEWFYNKGMKRLDVTFDKPGGMVTAISCFSQGSYECPSLYGIRDGSAEEAVLSQLGKPMSEQIVGGTKTLRYPEYNLTLYLEKRRVYLLRLSTGASN